MLLDIEPRVMNYEWGTLEGVARLFPIPNSSGQPVAELWYGAHVKAPSLLRDRPDLDLRQLLHAHGSQLLGKEIFRKYGGELPFLFKILSAAKGLSIQVHPSLAQAVEGYEREEAQGIALDNPVRNYKDRNHKPECIIALEDFYALSGFRRPEETSRLFAEIRQYVAGVSSAGARTFLESLMEDLDGPADSTVRIENFYRRLAQADAGLQQELIQSALSRAARTGEQGELSPWYWVQQLESQFPGDAGCLAPLYLNVLKLSYGQGLFMEAGVLHAYLRGTGLELMANSDNVIRAGCTPKHVDIAELLKTVKFESPEPVLLQADERGWYPSHVPEFRIGLMRPGSGTLLDLRSENMLGSGPAVLLVRSGRVMLRRPGMADHGLEAGQALFISAATDEQPLELYCPETAEFALAAVSS